MIGLKRKPTLSIVVPVYNTKAFLTECLDSINNATKRIESEIIIVDDGSNDGSLDVIGEYANGDNRFRVYNVKGVGPGGARNFGVKKAKGEYLAFVDSDDFVAEDIYANMILVADQHKSDMVVCDVIRKDGSKYLHSELHRKAFYNVEGGEIDIKRDWNLIFDGTSPNRLIRKSFYTKNNISFPENTYYEDVSTVQRMYCLANDVRFVHKWGYCWRIRRGSISQQQFNKKNIVDRIAMLQTLKKNAKELKMPPEYVESIDYKILSLEFNGCISILKNLPKETAQDYLEMIANYVVDNVDLRIATRLSLYDQQKVQLILNKDADGLIRLLNYKKANYMNAPIIECDGDYKAMLPEKLFTIESRSIDNEFNDMPYWMSIDSVDRSDRTVIIHTHVYIRRINMPDFSSQDVKAFLINDISGEKIKLNVVPELRSSLTEARGTVLNYDDYMEYNYNYDGTGFSIEINVDDIVVNDKFDGWNYIMLECYNKLGSKKQVLRFGTKKAVEVINGIEIERGNARLSFSMDEIQVFGITKHNKQEVS